jgi:OFA family oxalate/formate antiporter-like MFS transporter
MVFVSMNIAKRIIKFWDIYYGWVIVAIAMISMGFWLGIRNSFSVFYVALLEDFPWSRGDSAGVQSMALISYTVLAPLVGGLIDRFGPRRVIVPGILVLTVGLALSATIETLTQFYLFYGVILGGGITCIGIVSYSAILSHWFEKKRGLASGIAVSGMGLGTFLLVPISQRFISMWGWRMTFIALAVLTSIILVPLNSLFLRHKPEEVNQPVDGIGGEDPVDKTCPKVTEKTALQSDWTPGKALLSPNFWALMAFCFFSIIGIYVVLVHNVRFLVDQGIDKMTAALIFAVVGAISSVFRIFWGWLSDRIGREVTFTVGMICACIGVGFLLLIERTGARGFIYPFAFFFGMGWGVSAPMFMSTAADLFKGRIFGLIYGLVEAGIGIAGAFGAWMAGFIFDKYQSYQWAFIMTIIVFLLSCFFIWLAAPRKTRLSWA